MTDNFKRSISNMRVSVTTECNMKCAYCGGGEKCSNMLTPAQINQVCSAAAKVGVNKLRFTGGEPLLRADLAEIIAACSKIDGIEQISLTTNGLNLSEKLNGLISAGLNSINISLDCTGQELYYKLTNSNNIQNVLQSIREAAKLLPVKLNCVPLLRHYRQQARELAEFAAETGAVPRFIELMPMGAGAGLTGVDNSDVLKYLQELYGTAQICEAPHGSGPAVYYSFPKLACKAGFISPMSHSFCAACSRIRLTAGGVLRPCLASESGVDLLPALLKGEALEPYFIKAIEAKPQHHNLSGAAMAPLCETGG